MVAAIEHRGRHGGRGWTDGAAALGWRRHHHLSPDPLPELPSRPVAAVLDGVIYNAAEIQALATPEGVPGGDGYSGGTGHPAAAGDGGVDAVVRGYRHWGPGVFRRLEGMFAAALWDPGHRRLILARDPFGIKPLYYTYNTDDGSFLFGSEIKSFLRHPGFRKEFNRTALRPYLTFQYSVLDETFFRGVYKLPPGTYLELPWPRGREQPSAFRITPFASPPFAGPARRPGGTGTGDAAAAPPSELQRGAAAAGDKAGLDRHIQAVKAAVSDSVARHKPHRGGGSFLSGGIDSSFITALMGPEKTFSAGFKDYDGIFNETDVAADLARHLGVENFRCLIGAREAFESLPAIQYHLDEPQSNPSCVPLYFLSRMAAEHVNVVLSGEGADELFGGYDSYQPSPAMARYRRLVPAFLRRAGSAAASRLPANRITDFAVRGGQTVEQSFIGQARVFSDAEAAAVLRDEYAGGPPSAAITGPVYARAAGADDLTKMQHLDMTLWLPGDILLKADKLTAAHSLEVRMPFLDKGVMDAAAAVPAAFRIRDGQGKYPLRMAAADYLPRDWVSREKVGFSVPIRHWLRRKKYYGMVRGTFRSEAARRFFKEDKLLALLDGHFSGRVNNARRIWTVYVFLTWYGVFFPSG